MLRRLMMVLLLAGSSMALAPAAWAQKCPGVDGWVFEDVEASDPFCPSITWMAEAGVTLGCATIECSEGLVCRGGACVGNCEGVACPPGQACENGWCTDGVAPRPCPWARRSRW